MPERARGTVLVAGATSAIARAVAAELARRGHALVLAARDAGEAEAVAADLRVRFGVAARAEAFDALDFASHAPFAARLVADEGDVLEGVVVALGWMGDRDASKHDTDEARRTIDVNLTAVVSLLTPLADHLEKRRAGFICVVSSVAGDRGRQSNYVYGAAKGGLSVYLQGLRNRLHPAGVRVVTVKPGFVDTRMTFGRARFLVASPDRVGKGIVRAIDRGADVVYLPGFWRPVMLAIRAVPERIFKRLKL